MAKIYGNTTATPIPIPVVDQNYSGESANAQSGKAVAKAIKSKADKQNEWRGFEGGDSSSATTGGAIGYGAQTREGGAVGWGAVAAAGFSGGRGAKVGRDDHWNYIDAIQLGKGTNYNPKTLQVYDYTLMNEDGSIPEERLTKAKAYTDEKIGDIETALDTIIAMQNELTGGGEV